MSTFSHNMAITGIMTVDSVPVTPGTVVTGDGATGEAAVAHISTVMSHVRVEPEPSVNLQRALALSEDVVGVYNINASTTTTLILPSIATHLSGSHKRYTIVDEGGTVSTERYLALQASPGDYFLSEFSDSVQFTKPNCACVVYSTYYDGVGRWFFSSVYYGD